MRIWISLGLRQVRSQEQNYPYRFYCKDFQSHNWSLRRYCALHGNHLRSKWLRGGIDRFAAGYLKILAGIWNANVPWGFTRWISMDQLLENIGTFSDIQRSKLQFENKALKFTLELGSVFEMSSNE
jgi:hypothetical protein